LVTVFSATPETPGIRVPGLAAILAEFGRPVAVLEDLDSDCGLGYRFGALDTDGLVWAVRAESIYQDVARAVIHTVWPARTGPVDRDALLRETLTEFISNATINRGDAAAPPADDVTAGQRVMDITRQDVAAVALRPGTLLVDGEPYAGVTAHWAGYLGVAATCQDLLIVAIVPRARAGNLRLGTVATPTPRPLSGPRSLPRA
jgi:hypothetical protein